MNTSERIKSWGPSTIAAVVLASLGVWNTLKSERTATKSEIIEQNAVLGRIVAVEKEIDEQKSWRVSHDDEQRAWLLKLTSLETSNAALVQWTESTDMRLSDIGRDIREIRRQTGINKLGPSDFENGRGGQP